jgi:c-di-GMP-binding flagellar brake protein YcgR
LSDQNKKAGEAAKPAELIPVPEKEAHQLLAEGAESLSSTMFWIRDQKVHIRSHLTVFDRDNKTLQVFRPLDLDLPKFLEELKKAPEQNVYFNVSLLQANLAFKAPLLKADDHELFFGLPIADRVFKIQRRTELRFIVPDGQVIKVQFKDPFQKDLKHSKNILNISAGGIAFLIAPEDEASCQPGILLKDVTLTIQGRTIKVDAQIRHTTLLKDGRNKGEIKVGVLFTNIKPEDTQFLASFVFEEHRKIYSRFI